MNNIIVITITITGSACCKPDSHAPFTHSFSRKPFDVWAFLKGIFGNTDVERPVNNPNMGAFWGQVVFKALAPKFKTRGLETLEARDSTDEAVNFWSNFAQHELDLPALQ